jgi:hypothetical protein
LVAVRQCSCCRKFLHQECSCGTDEINSLRKMNVEELDDGNDDLCKLCFHDLSILYQL